MSGEVEGCQLWQCHALSTQSFLASEEAETEDLHTFASHCAMGGKKTLSGAASFCEEVCPSGYFLFGPTLKCKIGSLPLNNTFCGRLAAS